MYQVSYNENERIVYQIMEGFLKGEEHNQAWSDSIELLNKHECKYWFIDARTQKVVNMENQLWIRDMLIHKIVSTSIKLNKELTIARIESEDLFNEASAVLFIKLVEKYQMPINYKTFTNYDEGKAWLMSFKEE